MILPSGNRFLHTCSLLYCLAFLPAAAQEKDLLSYVDPLIGTTKSNVPTRWGSEGGTYPGAVAPAGYLQLTPETRAAGAKGYDYTDSVIYYFSCLRHYSGFPSGSAGHLLVMPVADTAGFSPGNYRRRFSHTDEKAAPGYYSVLFRDNHTRVEATATTRAGMFRFTFPQGVTPQLFISDSGRYGMAMRCSEPYTGIRAVAGGYLFSFPPSASGDKTLLLRLSASGVGKESAERNMAVELDAGFDEVRERTRRAWLQALSAVEVTDDDEARKKVFYTALYHTLLMPWIISDVDGRYRGADGQVHTTDGKNEYGGFSPWDTFRSLHPLLCLLYPDKQQDMVRSMLNVFRQTGHLPVESMTGNHAVPVIVDSWLKGIRGADSILTYTALKKSIADTPFIQADMPVFRRQGYVPFSWPESVTRTVEYAYDDWALAQFARQVMGNDADHRLFLHSSYAYRHLFHPGEMLLLPRKDSTFRLQPGTSGYKEGDAWIYSWFVPQHPQDLVNLMGGPALFTRRLDSALAQQQVLFDNETVFHVPWLFNAAGAPQKTQQWVGHILRTRFTATPGGLPGNDDLGSTSGWYLLSAMGLYPLCPGLPEYTIGAPLFRRIRIHLQNGKQLVIERSAADGPYIQSLALDGKPYPRLTIPHIRIMKGGTLRFETADAPSQRWPVLDTADAPGRPHFHITHYALSADTLTPHAPGWIRFSLRNTGSMGTLQMQLKVNDKVYAYKNCLADSGATITDSIPFRLYRPGRAHLSLNGLPPVTVTVQQPEHPYPGQPEISDWRLSSLVEKGALQTVTFTAQNTGGVARRFRIPVLLHDSLLRTVAITLQPGEKKRLHLELPMHRTGWQTLAIYGTKEKFKVYDSARATLLLHLQPEQHRDGMAPDLSGFDNNARVIYSGKEQLPARQPLLLGEDCFVEVPHAPGLDQVGQTLTMMAWVKPAAAGEGLVDLFTKGDAHVLQVVDQKTLNFFAGGWGRGECSAPLPDNWLHHWHHVAGVCDGVSLRLYIDGALKAVTPLSEAGIPDVHSHWTIGRNEEFPSARIFNGYLQDVKLFAAPLPAAAIQAEMGARP
ncbi:GH92 family glycosyl hydrolase [Chitinophaga japonensis]|uniref:Putative alpha-1,2-mannosidase n=1 Tax=Chitinophaga japonensis TaxID=104662 RepID=A0A562SRV7_CHIJA|nr:GH92 family glycosyl hydrolase [Chitinophaga japonensis]TWI83999.1 putative alpha-1,2-mannosidase [Chitinophaga japonensis]